MSLDEKVAFGVSRLISKASNPGSGDEFGGRFASLSGDTAVISARNEDSNGVGVNPDSQGDNSAADSGAAYVFTGLVPDSDGDGLPDSTDPCTAAVQVSYNNQTNTLLADYTIGADNLSFFSTSLLTSVGVIPLTQSFFPPLLPAISFPIEFPLQPVGAVGVIALLTDGSVEGVCGDFSVTATSGSGLSLSEARERSRRHLERLQNR